MNARETLKHVAHWFGWQDEQLSAGLKNAFDALRLYDYAQANPDLPEMADEWDEKHRIAAVGYDPLADYEAWHEAETTGANEAANALRNAYTLIDSVAHVAKPGDKERVLPEIARVISAMTVA